MERHCHIVEKRSRSELFSCIIVSATEEECRDNVRLWERTSPCSFVPLKVLTDLSVTWRSCSNRLDLLYDKSVLDSHSAAILLVNPLAFKFTFLPDSCPHLVSLP